MKHYSFVLSTGIAGVVLADNEDAAKRTICAGIQLHMDPGDELPYVVAFQEEHEATRIWFLEEGNLFRECDWESSQNELRGGGLQ